MRSSASALEPEQRQVSVMSHHVWTSLSGWASRSVIALSQLVAIRVMAPYLGIDDYAVFAILAGLAGWFALADFGVAAGLQNTIAGLRARNIDYDAYLRATAALVLGMLAVALVLSAALALWLGSWLLSKVSGDSATGQMIYVFVASSLLGMTAIGSIAFKLWFAEGKGYLANLAQAVGASLSILGLLVVTQFQTEHGLLLCLIVYFVPNCLIALGVVSFKVLRKSKRLASSDFQALREIRRRSLKFWLVAISAIAVTQIDYVIMSQLLRSQDIAVYSIVSKLFLFAFYLYSSMLASVWPTFSAKFALGDVTGVVRLTRKILGTGLVFGIVSALALYFLGGALVELLAPKLGLVVPQSLLALFGLYNLVRIWTDTFATVVQAADDLGVMLLAVPVQALASAVLQCLWVPSFGVTGVVLGLVCSFALTVSWILPLRLRIIVRRHRLRETPI